MAEKDREHSTYTPMKIIAFRDDGITFGKVNLVADMDVSAFRQGLYRYVPKFPDYDLGEGNLVYSFNYKGYPSTFVFHGGKLKEFYVGATVDVEKEESLDQLLESDKKALYALLKRGAIGSVPGETPTYTLEEVTDGRWCRSLKVTFKS